jgi:hypothetical protein
MLRASMVCGGTIWFVLFGFVLTAGAAGNPVPFIGQPLSPTKIIPGSAGFTLTVKGTGFVPGSAVRWNGSALPTTYENGEKLTARVPASALVSPRTAQVTVLNPPPGGGSSNFALFEVTKTTPTVLLFDYDRPATPAVNNSLVAGDFNGDGKLDIVAAMGASIAVLLGNGDGTFKVASFPTTAQFVGTLVAGDFNGDGKLDLVFPDPFHNLIITLLGNGDGTFTQVSTTPVGSNPAGTAAGDFNGDGKLDLAVVNQSGGNVSILLGNGDGTFTRKSILKVGSRPNAVAIADFNGDGKLDLAVVNSSSNTLSILLGRGDGTFTLKSSPATGASPYAVVASDFNGDGRVDLAVTNTCGNATSCQAHASGSVSVLLGVGDGTFTSSSVVLTNYHNPRGIAAGDFNADGKVDLVVSGVNESNGLVLRGDGKGHFASPVAASHAATGEFVILGDFNSDGRLDFALNSGFDVDGSLYVVVEEQVPVAFYPAVLRFPPQTVGTTSLPKTMKFTNVGIVPLNITKTEAGGFFAGTSDCPAILQVGASCTFTVTFTPGFVGLTGGGVSVTDDALGIVQSAGLEGRGK